MLDAIVGRGAVRDSGPLRVAATWLWTRFDGMANTELLELLELHGLAPVDASNLKHVDAALLTASVHMYSGLLRWCVTSASRRS
ncbi:hypothetical protein ACVWY6_004722 [Williamsia sp. R60]